MSLTTLRRVAIIWYLITAPVMGLLANIVLVELGFSWPHFWAGTIASLVLALPIVLAARAAEVIGTLLRASAR